VFINYSPQWGVCWKLSDSQYVYLEKEDGDDRRCLLSEPQTLTPTEQETVFVAEHDVDITIQYPLTQQLLEASLLGLSVSKQDEKLEEELQIKIAEMITDIEKEHNNEVREKQTGKEYIGPTQFTDIVNRNHLTQSVLNHLRDGNEIISLKDKGAHTYWPIEYTKDNSHLSWPMEITYRKHVGKLAAPAQAHVDYVTVDSLGPILNELLSRELLVIEPYGEQVRIIYRGEAL
jgi:hypothetical protein